MDISTDRLRTDIEATAAFGALDGDGHGRTVLTGSDANASNARSRSRVASLLMCIYIFDRLLFRSSSQCPVNTRTVQKKPDSIGCKLS